METEQLNRPGQYGGFQSKQQETFYYKGVEKVLALMTSRLMHHYKGESSDFTPDAEGRWVKHFRKVVKALNYMEKSKLSGCRLSEVLIVLSEYLKTIFVSFVFADFGYRMATRTRLCRVTVSFWMQVLTRIGSMLSVARNHQLPV